MQLACHPLSAAMALVQSSTSCLLGYHSSAFSLSSSVRSLSAPPCPYGLRFSSRLPTGGLYSLRRRGKNGPIIIVATASEKGPGGDGESKFGLGGPGTWFGFGRKQEREVGRLAMVGFVAGVVMEVLTGKGVLAQLGIDPVAVKYPLLAGLVLLFFGGLVGGFVVVNNPPDFSKVPPNEGAGLPRDPLKTYDPKNIDPLTTYTRGGQENEPYLSDLDLPVRDKKD